MNGTTAGAILGVAVIALFAWQVWLQHREKMAKIAQQKTVYDFAKLEQRAGRPMGAPTAAEIEEGLATLDTGDAGYLVQRGHVDADMVRRVLAIGHQQATGQLTDLDSFAIPGLTKEEADAFLEALRKNREERTTDSGDGTGS